MMIRQLLLEEYTDLSRERKSGLSDYYVRELDHGGGGLFGLVDDDGQILSYAILNQVGGSLWVSYIETAATLRRQGHGLKLLRGLLDVEAGPFFLHIASSYPGYEAVIGLARKVGLIPTGQSTIYSVPITDAYWARYDRMRLEKKSERFREPGSECLPFSALSEKQFRLLEDSGVSAFRNQLDPIPFLKNRAKGLDPEHSFAYYKDGALLAYTLITRPRLHNVVIEQISTTHELIGSGVVLVPLISTVQSFRKDPTIQKMSMTIYNDNTRSNRMVLHLLGDVGQTQVTNYNFIYHKH